MMINVYAAWIAMLVGVITGVLTGIYFHKEEFLGGYGSWPRRITRLGHISFFGLGFMNLLFALTVRSFEISEGIQTASFLLVVGLISMPLVCYVSAFRKSFRFFFFVPVLSVLVAIAFFIWRLFQL